ncbi:sugar phosphate isomerase/epimerase [Neorhizobium sp. T25_13]|uniref:sugar phosphate isomerase/epimerase family protein n=1 Tax=Neorhizobium sp. T25_13 TaxID=2093830 RepID=UPI000CF9D8A7
MLLIEEVDPPNLCINFDALHVWEGGDDPLEAIHVMKPFVDHYHLKYIRGREYLSFFAPENVYSANGNRVGMTPLFQGAFDYMPLISALPRERDFDASQRCPP